MSNRKVAGRVPAHELNDAILRHLPGRVSQLAATLGRPRTDRTLRLRLKSLAAAGKIVFDDGVWSRSTDDPIADTLPGYEFPPGFDDESRDIFRTKVDEVLNAEVPMDTFMVELLESYVRCLQRARGANGEIDRDGLFQPGAKGNRKFAHPGIATAREAERDAHIYREAIEKRKRREPGADQDDEFQLPLTTD